LRIVASSKPTVLTQQPRDQKMQAGNSFVANTPVNARSTFTFQKSNYKRYAEFRSVKHVYTYAHGQPSNGL